MGVKLERIVLASWRRHREENPWAVEELCLSRHVELEDPGGMASSSSAAGGGGGAGGREGPEGARAAAASAFARTSAYSGPLFKGGGLG